MRTIIAGSRSIDDFQLLLQTMKDVRWTITEVVCGGAKGVDTLGEKWAKLNHIDIKYFYPDWERYGKGAGFRRNREMVMYADALIAIWDGKSEGTKNTIMLAREVYRKDRIIVTII